MTGQKENTMTDAMTRLTEPWALTVTVDGEQQAQEFPPLIDMLAQRIFPDANFKGGGGLASTRNVLDVKSLDLLTNIEDVTRAWLQEWGTPNTRTVKGDLTAFWDRLHALRNSEGIDENTYDQLAAYPDTWAVRIWDLIEPPMRTTLRGTTCPRCGRAKWTETEDTSDSLLLVWRDGQEVTAECQWQDCAAIWVGEDGMLTLGREIGEEVNVDALTEARAARHAETDA